MFKYITILLFICFSNTAIANSKIYKTEIVIRNHMFEPSELVVPAGKKIKLTVKNEDKTPEEFESIDLKREKIVAGNSKTIISFGPLKPGEYKFFGEFHEDTAQGKIIVKEEE